MQVKITPPEISKETREAMIEFFGKTSFPRILAEKHKQEKETNIEKHRPKNCLLHT